MYNHITIVGRVGQDAVMHQTRGGYGGVTSFSVATNKKWKKKSGEEVERTDWHKVKCWGKLAEVAERIVKKGAVVLVDGEQHHDKYEAADGSTRYSAEIFANNLRVIQWPKGSTSDARDAGDEDEDPIPF